MAALVILLIAVITYFLTITLVVVGEEVHPLVSAALFIVVGYGAFRLFQSRLTRL
mgnify:FL=1